MGTVQTAGYRVVSGKPWMNQAVIEKFTYDFATDDMTAANDVQIGKFNAKNILLRAWCYVTTTFTSGGSATLDLGLTSDTNCILAAAAVAALVADTVQGNVTGGEGVLSPIAATDYVVGNVAVADMTAGKIEIFCEIARIG